MLSESARKIVELIQAIPAGRVSSYGQIAQMAGLPHGARQVAKILHSCSDKYHLPWHRVIGSSGKISLAMESGGAVQRDLLRAEGVRVSDSGKVDSSDFIWSL